MWCITFKAVARLSAMGGKVGAIKNNFYFYYTKFDVWEKYLNII